MPFVYILRCTDQTLYVGQTGDLASRLEWHNKGFGPRYTAVRRPVLLVYSEKLTTQAEATKRERQLKRWSAQKKEALVTGDGTRLKELSKRRQKKRKT